MDLNNAKKLIFYNIFEYLDTIYKKYLIFYYLEIIQKK